MGIIKSVDSIKGANMSEFAKKIVRKGVVIYERDGSILTNLQIITPRLGDTTRELQEKTAGFSLQEVFDGAKRVERGVSEAR